MIDMQKLIKYLPTPLVLVAFLLSFITLYAVPVLPILRDPDMGWHIMAGYEILSLGAIPAHDNWSFTGQQQVWYNLAWGWDILLSIIHEKLGMKGVFVFAKACPALVIALLVYFLRKRDGIGINAIIFTAFITTFCMMEFAYGRPQIFGFLLLLIFHHLLHKSREDNTAKNLFILPVLMVLWVNMHGSFFLGVIPLGAFGLEAIYAKKYRWLKHLLLVGFLCAVATLINPYGIYVYAGMMKTMNSIMAQYITEWQPFEFGKIMGATMWLVIFIYSSNLRASTAPLADKILVIISLTAMFLSSRSFGVLAMLGAPYLAANMPPDDVNDKNTKNLAKWGDDYAHSPLIALAAVLVVVAGFFFLNVLGKKHYYEDPRNSPLPAIEYVHAHYDDKKILNDYNIGGRIIYETGEKLPVFVDGRADTAYSKELLKDYISFMNLEKGWEKVIDKYDIEVLLLMNSSGFHDMYEKGFYHDQWQQVFHDDIASVYVKKVAAPENSPAR